MAIHSSDLNDQLLRVIPYVDLEAGDYQFIGFKVLAERYAPVHHEDFSDVRLIGKVSPAQIDQSGRVSLKKDSDKVGVLMDVKCGSIKKSDGSDTFYIKELLRFLSDSDDGVGSLYIANDATQKPKNRVYKSPQQLPQKDY